MWDFSPGSIMLDNTTIYGAKYAYEMWPPDPADWLRGTTALNLHSLMELLEAIVLHDQIVVDSSSSMISTDYSDTVWETIWDKIYDLKQYDNNLFREVCFAGTDEGAVVLLAANIALKKLQGYLEKGAFNEELKKFQGEGVESILPNFYRTPEDFRELLKKSLPVDSSKDTSELLENVTYSLQRATSELSNYAMFAFRGFYYQKLAHLFSISYSPHTWRTNIINFDIGFDSSERTSIDFARYLEKNIAEIRRELATNLNAEFNTKSFRVEIPVIASYIANQCDRREDLLRVAIEIRNSNSAKAFRAWIRDIQTSIRNQEELTKINRAYSDLELVISDVRKELGLLDKGEMEQVKIQLGVPVASVEIPVDVEYGLPDWMRSLFHRRTHLIFLKDIAKKSVNLSPFAYRYYQLRI
jgi:hypothetical protein